MCGTPLSPGEVPAQPAQGEQPPQQLHYVDPSLLTSGSSAQVPPTEPPAPVYPPPQVVPEPDPANVVYLHQHQQGEAAGAPPPAQPPAQEPQPAQQHVPAHHQGIPVPGTPVPPEGGGHVAHPPHEGQLQPGQYVNVLGEVVSDEGYFQGLPRSFFDDDEELDDDHEARPLGTLVLLVTLALLVVSIVVYVRSLQAGSGGATAGGFVLLAAIAWVGYLSMPDQQSPRVMRRWKRLSDRIDRRIQPWRSRADVGIAMRRERERYQSMRMERSRRVGDLGEASYRAFRAGTLPPELAAQAQRVIAIEQQMLLQDARLHELVARRDEAIEEAASHARSGKRRRRGGGDAHKG